MPRKTFTFGGKRYDVTAKTEAALAAKIALRKRDLEEGRVALKKMPCNKWCYTWLETYKKGLVSRETYKNYKVFVGHISVEYGATPLSNITTEQLQSFLNRHGIRSKSHVHKLNITIKQIFKQAKIEGYINHDPSQYLKEPKSREGSHRAITKQERSVILEVSKTHKAGPWIRTLLYCGLRPSESAMIQGRHIDIKNRVLYVNGSKTPSANRIVPIPEALILDLTGFEKNEYVFTNQAGNALSTQDMKRLWKSFKRAMNIYLKADTYRNQLLEDRLPELKDSPFDPPLTLYCLRHTYGTDLQNAGVPINVAKDLMGHSKIELTAKIYTHMSDVSFIEASKKINEYQQIDNEEKNSGQTQEDKSLNVEVSVVQPYKSTENTHALH